MADIFQEVDEDLRKERYEKLWKKYGVYAIGLLLGIVGATVGFEYWKYYTSSTRLENGERYASAVALIKPGEEARAADALAQAAKETSGGYPTLARLREAALRLDAGDTAKAIEIYDSMAADGDVDQLFRDLARLLSVMHQLDGGEASALIARLEPLTEAGEPWHHTAQELTAILAYKGGDNARAKEIYTGLSDDATTPQALRARATEMLAVIGE